MNSMFIVGRLVNDPELKELDDGKKVANITVAVQRPFKNVDGVYETDFFDCTLWEGLGKSLADYCKQGDTVGIRGRLQTSFYEKDKLKIKNVSIIAERISFLSSRREEKLATAEAR